MMDMRQRSKLPGHNVEFHSSFGQPLLQYRRPFDRKRMERVYSTTKGGRAKPGLPFLLLHPNDHCLRINNTTDANENNEKDN